MSFDFRDLDETTRKLMLEEVTLDEDKSKLYKSTRMTQQGISEYPNLLRESIKQHDEAWLTNSLNRSGILKTHEERSKPSGGTSTVKVPVNAAATFAEGEFNRFYIRALCVRCLREGGTEVTAYRAKQVSQERAQSQLIIIGKTFNAKTVLNDLRENPGVETALGIPGGPNSGVSVTIQR